jgi:hypothetical protein
MTKKSLFFGGLALLVILALAGCSNPASGDPESSTVAGNPDIPRDAVLAGDFEQLVGLLNDTNADTNGVENIAYAGAFSTELTIRDGKTVYWWYEGENDTYTLVANLIVEEGARLVILGGSTLSTDGAKKQLLVKGKVDVYGGLTIGANALDVADYFEANETKEARGTVIGTSRVAIGAGGKLTLKADDIANTNTENRFTPPQAWAAAGKGDLEVSGELSSTYTVTYMLKDISLPAGGRWYTFETAGGDLPSSIPAGADVTTNAAITETPDNTLTIYGRLTAPNATLGSITALTISGLDTDTSAAKSAAPTFPGWNEGYLKADVATLASAVSVNILDRGEFVSASKAINPPADSKINLGRSAIFTASGDSVNTFEKLSGLYAGPGASVSIASTALTFAGLKTLTLQDGAKLEADDGAAVTFLVDPNAKTAISLGANTLYKVGVSPAAKVDVAITNNSSLNKGSVLKVNEGSTFTLDAGKTFTVQPGATFDLSGLGTTVPTAAPVQINGTVVFKGEGDDAGTLIGPNPGLFDDATAISKFVAFGPDGKFEFNYGGAYIFAAVPEHEGPLEEIKYIGKAGGDAAFALGSNSRVSISGSGISIGATNKGGFTVVAVEEDGAYIAKDQTLTLDINAELQLGVGEGVMFAGDANGGARLEGPGKIVVLNGEGVYATITAGSGTWRAHGAGSVAIVNPEGGKTVITTFELGDASFKALGASAVIEVEVDQTLTIAASTTIDLSEGGTLSIKAEGESGTKISLPAATSIIKTNAAAGAAVTQESKKLSINGVELDIGNSTAMNAASADTGGLLSSIVGADSDGAITVKKAPVSINNTAVVTVAASE